MSFFFTTDSWEPVSVLQIHDTALETPTSLIYLCLTRCVHGQCIPLDTQSYRCECEDGYRGALCNQQGELFNPCRRLSCKHGRCQISDTGDAYCHCESGYTGELCDAGWFSLCQSVILRKKIRSTGCLQGLKK